MSKTTNDALQIVSSLFPKTSVILDAFFPKGRQKIFFENYQTRNENVERRVVIEVYLEDKPQTTDY